MLDRDLQQLVGDVVGGLREVDNSDTVLNL
jgi:hypothetical protein